MARHSDESTIDLSFTSFDGLGGPANDMVLEDTLVELMKEIRSKAREDIAVW